VPLALHFVEAVVVWATSGEPCGTEVGVYDGRVGGGATSHPVDFCEPLLVGAGWVVSK